MTAGARASPDSERRFEVLLIAQHTLETAPLQKILSEYQCELYVVRTPQQGLRFLEAHPLGVIIYDISEPSAERWQDLLRQLSEIYPTPRLIVASRIGDETMWAEVLNLGGFDLLLKPYDPDEVRRVSTHAWRSWMRDARQDSRELRQAAQTA
jgi:DNA-binding NtrC family response regulator